MGNLSEKIDGIILNPFFKNSRNTIHFRLNCILRDISYVFSCDTGGGGNFGYIYFRKKIIFFSPKYKTIPNIKPWVLDFLPKYKSGRGVFLILFFSTPIQSSWPLFFIPLLAETPKTLRFACFVFIAVCLFIVYCLFLIYFNYVLIIYLLLFIFIVYSRIYLFMIYYFLFIYVLVYLLFIIYLFLFTSSSLCGRPDFVHNVVRCEMFCRFLFRIFLYCLLCVFLL